MSTLNEPQQEGICNKIYEHIQYNNSVNATVQQQTNLNYMNFKTGPGV